MKKISPNIKEAIRRKTAKPTFTYACESWTITKKHINRATAIQMRFLRRVEGKQEDRK